MFEIFKKKKIEVKIDYVWYEVSETGILQLANTYEERLKRNRVEYNNLQKRHRHNQGRIVNTRAYKEMDAKHKTKIKQQEDTIKLLNSRIENLISQGMLVEVTKECEE